MEIITTPNPALLKTAEPIKKFDKKLLELIEEMDKTLKATYDPVGVGLAAPQVGLNIRLFITKHTEKGKTVIFANPVIISSVEAKKAVRGKTKKKFFEGCLSIPNIWGDVTRKKETTLSYQDEKGTRFQKSFSGFLATIIQHEIDHLDGNLFTKRVMEQGEQLYRSFKNAEGEDEFEEIKI